MNGLSRGGAASILLLVGILAACDSELNRPRVLDSGAHRDFSLDGDLASDKAKDGALVDSAEPGLDSTAPVGDVLPDTAQIPGDSAGPQPDAVPVLPAEPFGVWTSACSATPYPTQDSNAYPTDFQQAVADDWVYIAWVWRLSPDAATNHSVSAMKSKDMKTWFNLCGDPVSLPVTPASPTVIDPVPTHSGLLNSRLALSLDAQNRPVVTYHKNITKTFSDGTAALTTQVFNARPEGGAITIYQMTSWNTLHDFSGGGSLPASDTSISFSGLRLGPSDLLAQSFNRSTADDLQCQAVESGGGVCEAYPKDGTWELEDSPLGLALRAPLTAVTGAMLASPDPFEAMPYPGIVTGSVENTPLSNDPQAASWQIVTMRSRAESRWITLRADFDGDGSNNPGLFDRYNSWFRLDAGTSSATFRFGARQGLFWPLTGDWDGDGVMTVGVHDAVAEITYLRNTLTPGLADVTLVGPLSGVAGVTDSPLRWHVVNPTARYAIKWETLPTNRDMAYSCLGIPLQSKSGCADPDLMSSNLYLLEYDDAAGTWQKSLIDRAWAGTRVGFDFLTFKNVQLVAYYGADRQLKIAQRVRQAGAWSAWAIASLPSTFGGWDSHNYLTLTIDTNHNVHVSGNMHASPLVYFRGTGYLGHQDPLTYMALSMTGKNETATTYPKFLRGPNGTLLFTYRSGSSGSGDTYLNSYDEGQRTWAPLHGSAATPVPLFKGL